MRGMAPILKRIGGECERNVLYQNYDVIMCACRETETETETVTERDNDAARCDLDLGP